MCGRFALTLPQSAAREHFQASLWPEPDNETPLLRLDALDRPRFNIRPTETVLVVAADAEKGRVLRPMRWGFLPHWYKSPSDGPLLINARGETLVEKPAFKTAARERRCLIPADGFYEWQVESTGATTPRGKPIVKKTPYWIRPSSGAGMAFAGVWSEWAGADGVPFATVAIVTCAANQTMASLHERLPVVVPPEGYGLWLGEEGHGAAALMRSPAEDFYAFHVVSNEINVGGRAAPDHAALIEPAPAVAEPADAGASETPRLI